MEIRVLIISLLLGAGFVTGAAGSGPARGPVRFDGDERGIFRITPEPWPPQDGRSVHSICSGIFLAPEVALTAAHCLESREMHLSLACRDADDRFLIETVPLARVARHESRDVALLVFASPPPCRSGMPPIAETLGAEEQFFIRRAPPAVADVRRYMPQSERDASTVSLRDEEVCLSPEEAGTPLFVAREEGRALLAGLLIKAAGRCQGDLTFVRLGGLRGWIDAVRAGRP